MTSKRLYMLSAAACVAGYIWLAVSVAYPEQGLWSGCWFKQLFHIPCPACGSTRAIIALSQGHMKEALLLNPNGFLVAIWMLVIPLWIVIDWIWKKDSYYSFYKEIDKVFSHKFIFLVFLFFVLMNWFWNITKGF